MRHIVHFYLKPFKIIFTDPKSGGFVVTSTQNHLINLLGFLLLKLFAEYNSFIYFG